MEHPVSPEANPAPYTPPRYTREWIYTFLALAVAFTLFFRIQHPLVSTSPRSPAADSIAQESFWFFALQLPNPAPDQAPEECLRKSTDWLNSLLRSGFHPMLLSDVRTRMLKGMLLPEKTIVLSFDEALLTTYDTYEPLLRDLKIPAVLMTSLKPLRQGDRGYLSYKAVQKLPSTGFWDVILMDDRAQPKILAPQEVPLTLPLLPEISPWSSNLDRSLANQLSDLRRPRRLSIDWRWSGQDVVHRLEAETPIHPNGSRLGVRPVMGRLWGVVLSKEKNAEDRFSLNAPVDQRGTDIGWLGTRGLENFQLDFSLKDATGQVWFLLRSTGEHGNSLRVGFSDGKVVIKEQIAGQQSLLGMTDWPRGYPWTGTIHLCGSALRVMHQGQTLLASRVHRTAHPSQAMLQLVLYDQLYGAAQARDVSLEVIPLLDPEATSIEGLR
jgi:hypothetical protein